MTFHILLGSSSKRRYQLLQSLNHMVSVVTPGVDETYPTEASSPEEGVMLLASRKFEALAAHHHFVEKEPPPRAMVTADTLAFLDLEPLGKPSGTDQAIALLKKLSGRAHTVITGYVVYGIKGKVCQSVSTIVVMRKFSDSEVEAYVATGSPFDKAGGYGIQDQACAGLIETVYGSISNVVGLPVAQIQAALAQVV